MYCNCKLGGFHGDSSLHVPPTPDVHGLIDSRRRQRGLSSPLRVAVRVHLRHKLVSASRYEGRRTRPRRCRRRESVATKNGERSAKGLRGTGMGVEQRCNHMPIMSCVCVVTIGVPSSACRCTCRQVDENGAGGLTSVQQQQQKSSTPSGSHKLSHVK